MSPEYKDLSLKQLVALARETENVLALEIAERFDARRKNRSTIADEWTQERRTWRELTPALRNIIWDIHRNLVSRTSDLNWKSINALVDRGLIEDSKGRLKLTEKGRRLASYKEKFGIISAWSTKEMLKRR